MSEIKKYKLLKFLLFGILGFLIGQVFELFFKRTELSMYIRGLLVGISMTLLNNYFYEKEKEVGIR